MMQRIDARMNSFEKVLFDMSDDVERALENAFKALELDSKEMALDVMEYDDIINSLEARINIYAIEILSLLQPMARDLRLIIGGIRIANELERIGDYAKEIARFILSSKTIEEKTRESFNKLGILLLSNLSSTFDLMKNRDIKKAYEVALLDDDLDLAYQKFLSDLVDIQKNNLVDITRVLRSIERAGDHAKNICEIVIYIEGGQFIDFG